jgi:N-acetylmuramoyl-L-alanine amidase
MKWMRNYDEGVLVLKQILASLAVTLCALSLEAAGGGVVLPADALYNDAVAKEKAVRAALVPGQPQPTVLKAVRTVVEQYELIVRTYPSSGYCDDALWQAGRLSLDAYQKFRNAEDRDAALRLLRALASRYPTSKYAKEVPAQITRAGSLGNPKAAPVVAIEATPAMSTRPLPAATSAAARPSPPPAAAAKAPAATGPSIATIKDIRRTILPDVVRVTVELDGEVKFREERLSDPARVFVDLTAARAAPALIDQTLRFDSDAELVREIRLGRHPNNTTRVVLEAAGVSSFSVYTLYSPYRLVIDCVRPVAVAPASLGATPPTTISSAARPLANAPLATAPRPLIKSKPLTLVPFALSTPPIAAGADLIAGALLNVAPVIATTAVGPLPAIPMTTIAERPPLPAAPSKNIAGGFSIARQLGLGVSRIVIDPGHGGHDPGAKGNGITEAELVLDIAVRLEKLLVGIPGVEVVLTRRGDEYIPLQERTAMANREGADLFLSIHANASSNKQAMGVESYFLNFSSNPNAEAIAARENAASGLGMAEVTNLANAIMLNNKLDESRDLATMVQRAMIEKLKGTNKSVRDLGVKQAPFVVLIGAAMPSVLSEVSFLTNSQEARLLRNSSYRQRIAEALFTAIRKYQTSLKSTTLTAARP